MQHFNWKSLKFPELVFINFGLVSNSILSFKNWTLNINSVIGVFRYNFCILFKCILQRSTVKIKRNKTFFKKFIINVVTSFLGLNVVISLKIRSRILNILILNVIKETFMRTLEFVNVNKHYSFRL